MTVEISVARGLAELKLLDKRIDRAIREATFGGIQIGNRVSAGFTDVEEIEKAAESGLQSVNALIKRRNAIKSAIVVSNAITMAVVAGELMTVAEAIERKTSIEYEEHLLNKLKLTYTSLTSQIDTNNYEMQQRLDKHLETLFGKEGEINAKENGDIVLAFRRDNEAKLIDSINLKRQIEELENSIDGFLSEVDFVLNESNVLTNITVEE